jgi:mannosylfructose-phosphate synthase
VKWLGHVEDDAMANFYRATPVFALPSRYEPFGMTAAEAMACGTPCVVTVHGGLEEMFDFGSHALFADPKRPREFAVMLSMPLRYPQLRQRLSIVGARFARRMFGWRGIARRTLAAFERARSQHDRMSIDTVG